MYNYRLLLLAIPFLSLTSPTVAQERVCVGFYNVENLHDTIPSRFYDDGDFTPGGRYRWGEERYGKKLSNLARVIGDMDPCVLGLAEVESEDALRDLVLTLAEDYNYIHRTSRDSRGMDLALLYKGDRFVPESTRMLSSPASRDFLLVKGELMGEPVSLVLCHLPSKANRHAYRKAAMDALAACVDSLLKSEPLRKLILMGDFNADPSEKIFRVAFGDVSAGFHTRSMLYGAIEGPASGGFGSYAYGGRWYLFDNILLSFGFIYGEGFRFASGGTFAREYMISANPENGARPGRKGYPFRTIASGVYAAGYSDHLPVFTILFR